MNLRALAPALLVFAALPIANAWYTFGHHVIAADAVRVAGEALPEDFVANAETVGYYAVEPDLMKNRQARHATKAEAPEHYMDMEIIAGKTPPQHRQDYIFMLAKMEKRVIEVGTLPYALQESVERLATAFMELRLRPDDDRARYAVFHAAGVLGHYAGDAVQPLHSSIHHDGFKEKDGSVTLKGVHSKVDGLFGRIGPEVSRGIDELEIEKVDNLRSYIDEQILESNSQIPRLYGLGQELWFEGDDASDEVRSFANDRYLEGVQFLGSLYVYAWELSAQIEEPFWLDSARTAQNYHDTKAESSDELQEEKAATELVAAD